MPKANINGVNIYYEIHGQGQPLVLIHHGIGSTRMWEEFIPVAASSYKVIVYDRIGFGRSDKGKNFRDYYLGDHYSEDSIKELSGLLEHLNIKQNIRLIGQCEGGVLAFLYAVYNPNAVAAIVASTTLCYSKITVPQYFEGKMFRSFEEADSEFKEKLIYWHGNTYAQELLALFLEIGGCYGSGVFDLRKILKKVECPSLVLYPDRSRLFEVEQGVLMYNCLPKGELSVLPHCGHNTYAEKPEEYQRIIISFLKSL
jgi:pimeloyl-ACP methyl ester carboxylesterase